MFACRHDRVYAEFPGEAVTGFEVIHEQDPSFVHCSVVDMFRLSG
jgi:hypothetical protein